MKDITITSEEYTDLIDSRAKLRALEAGGVDNWEWYDESLTAYHREKEIAEIERTMFTDILETIIEDCVVDYLDSFHSFIRYDGDIEIIRTVLNKYIEYKVKGD